MLEWVFETIRIAYISTVMRKVSRMSLQEVIRVVVAAWKYIS